MSETNTSKRLHIKHIFPKDPLVLIICVNDVFDNFQLFSECCACVGWVYIMKTCCNEVMEVWTVYCKVSHLPLPPNQIQLHTGRLSAAKPSFIQGDYNRLR